jgi:hypothetical protein
MNDKAKEIKITQSFKHEELKCTVCYEYLDGQIYQCPNGPHYACEMCNSKLTECPICRNKQPLIRAIYMEQELKKFLRPCQYSKSGCKKHTFPWDYTHAEVCTFGPMRCPLCKKLLDRDNDIFLMHLINECKIKYKYFTDMKQVPKESSTAIINDYVVALWHHDNIVDITVMSTDSKLIDEKVTISYDHGDNTYVISAPVITGLIGDSKVQSVQVARLPFIESKQFSIKKFDKLSNQKIPLIRPFNITDLLIPNLAGSDSSPESPDTPTGRLRVHHQDGRVEFW